MNKKIYFEIDGEQLTKIDSAAKVSLRSRSSFIRWASLSKAAEVVKNE